MTWLTLKDANKYSGISKDRLKALAAAGTVQGGREPGIKRWRFSRESIDRYFTEVVSRPVAREKALVILRGGRL